MVVTRRTDPKTAVNPIHQIFWRRLPVHILDKRLYPFIAHFQFTPWTHNPIYGFFSLDILLDLDQISLLYHFVERCFCLIDWCVDISVHSSEVAVEFGIG